MLILKKEGLKIAKGSIVMLVWFFVFLHFVIFVHVRTCSTLNCSLPVNVNVFGKFFLWGHWGFVLGILFFLSGMFLFLSLGFLESDVDRLIRIEKKRFFEKYNQKFADNFSKLKKNFLTAVMIFSLFLPVIFLTIAKNLFGADAELPSRIAIGIGVVLMFGIFYRGVFILMQKSQENMRDVFHFVNQHFPETNLELIGSDFGYSFNSVNYDLNLSGIYKGKSLVLKYKTSGTKFKGLPTKIKFFLEAIFFAGSSQSFVLKEKKMSWRKIKGVDVSDCFEQRFNLNGEDVRNFSVKLKEIVLNFRRNLVLEVDAEKMVYRLEKPDVLPFYSAEGMILFFDFLDDFASEIN